MKIAAVTEDGVTISQHFGRAPYYVVLTVEDGQITSRQQREKPAHGHGHRHGQRGHVELVDQPHDEGAAGPDTHGRMAEPIRDCEVVLTRGMGGGAYNSLQRAGIRPIITVLTNIDEAALQAANGSIEDHPERLH
jgi:predicted Fe-Mo cluster-binding NifX family protein